MERPVNIDPLKGFFIPGLILAALLTVLFALGAQIQQEHVKSRKIEVEVTAEQARRRVESFFNARVVPLKFISDRMREEMSERGFEEIAGKFIEQYGGYQAVNWIDPSWTIRITVPAAGNEGALNQDLHQHPDPTVPPAIARAERDHVLTATAAIDLLQGGMGIALYLPVLDRDGALVGFVNGVFRVDALMENSLPEAGLRERFDFALTDIRGREAYNHGDGSSPALWKDPVTVPLEIIDDTWVFTVTHSSRFAGVKHDSWAGALTFFGIILSLVVVFAFRAILVREQKLRLSEERFRSITNDVLDNLHAGILITDARRRVVWSNRSIERYLGITRKEMIGRDQRDLIRTRIKDVFADPGTFEKKLLAAYEDNTYMEHFECHVLPAEGRKERWLEHRSQPIISGLYAGGRVEHYYGITSRRKAEAAMAESREKLRAILDNAADGILLADVETGSFVECNNEMCRMTGYSHPELLNLSVGDIHPPEELERVRVQFQRQAAGEIKMAHDIPVLRKDGSVFFTDVSSGPVTLDGKVYLVGLFRDATERKQAEEDLRRSEKNWESIFQSIGHPAVILSPSMTVMEANNATVQATGLPLDELTGKRCWEIFHAPGSSSPPSGCPFPDVLRSGEVEVRDMEVEMLGGWYLVSCTPIFSEDGELAKVIHIATDITAQRTVAEQLRQSQKMEAVGVLAGGIAHDFNNILQAVRGYAEIALMGAGPRAGTVKQLNGILAAVEHGARITGQMLAFSRKQILKLEILDMNEVVRSLTDFLRRIIGEDITLSVEYEEGPLLIKADSGQIQQVLMNLAVNAREAMPGGGEMFIVTSGVLVGEEIVGEWEQVAPGPYAMFSVVDTGCGIEDEHKDHIFEPFYSTKGREKGTGLGLSTVFGIIRQHGGFIQFSSEPGEGTVFRVYLPIAEQGERSAKVRDAAMPPVRGAGQVVLVVEDEEMVRELAEAMLHSLGYRVITAATPGECIDLVSGYDGPIHLLLSDVVMPGMNGPQLYKTLRKMRPDIPALFMSGYPDALESFERPDGDPRNFLQKPFTIEMLAAAVRAVLGVKG